MMLSSIRSSKRHELSVLSKCHELVVSSQCRELNKLFKCHELHESLESQNRAPPTHTYQTYMHACMDVRALDPNSDPNS